MKTKSEELVKAWADLRTSIRKLKEHNRLLREKLRRQRDVLLDAYKLLLSCINKMSLDDRIKYHLYSLHVNEAEEVCRELDNKRGA